MGFLLTNKHHWGAPSCRKDHHFLWVNKIRKDPLYSWDIFHSCVTVYLKKGIPFGMYTRISRQMWRFFLDCNQWRRVETYDCLKGGFCPLQNGPRIRDMAMGSYTNSWWLNVPQKLSPVIGLHGTDHNVGGNAGAPKKSWPSCCKKVTFTRMEGPHLSMGISHVEKKTDSVWLDSFFLLILFRSFRCWRYHQIICIHIRQIRIQTLNCCKKNQP